MEITPDNIIYWQWGIVRINATILFTWFLMAFLAIGSWLITRNLSTGTTLSRWQNLLEAVVSEMRKQIRDVSKQEPGTYLDFIGTVFLFIALSNLLVIVPGYNPPTGSLSTAAALAICVLIAVPLYGIAHSGLRGYLKNYVTPSIFMLPFNIMSELSRTLALAVRLFGNIMSGTMIVGILIAVTPLFFPILMRAFGLLTGLIQAYIFAILAMVYIASATRVHTERESELEDRKERETSSENKKEKE